jgi:acrylyl-CoA reductase (NADPH)
MTTTVGLDEVPRVAEEILAGKVRGRVVVEIG